MVYRSDKTEVQNDKEKERRRHENKGARETRRDSQGCDKVNSTNVVRVDKEHNQPTDRPTNRRAG